MRKNTLKEIWAKGGAVINGWCSIPSSFSAEIMAHQGFDSITIDMQHGLVDYQVATTMLQAISTTSVIPLTRVPWRDPGALMKILDAGSYGVICPMINTPKMRKPWFRPANTHHEAFAALVRSEPNTTAEELLTVAAITTILPMKKHWSYHR